MEKQIFKAASRGTADYGWLHANYVFSFANYYHPDRVNFGALRVLNDDIVEAGQGFNKHPHDNMEIITIPLKGSLMHRDSMGHESILSTNEVQVMSAGTGIFHSELNASKTEALNLFQIWIFPSEKNIKPSYNQNYFDPEQARNNWQNLVSPAGNKGLTIHQNAWIHRAFLSKATPLTYEIHSKTNGIFIMVVSGQVVVQDEILSERDSIGLTGLDTFKAVALEDSHIIAIEVPQINN